VRESSPYFRELLFKSNKKKFSFSRVESEKIGRSQQLSATRISIRLRVTVCMCVLMCNFVSYFVCVILCIFVFLCDILLPSGVINDDIHHEPYKHATRYSFITLRNVAMANVENYVTVGLSSKFTIQLMSYFPPHLKCVTTLPCEIQKCNNSNILDIRPTYHNIIDLLLNTLKSHSML